MPNYTDFLPILPKTQSVSIIGESRTFSDRGNDISDRSCLIDALNYEKISHSVFQVGTIMAYDCTLNKWDTFYSWHIWAIDLNKKHLADFAIPRLASVAQQLNFDFLVLPEKMNYTIVPYTERQKAWDALGSKGDRQPDFFGDAHLIYVPSAIPSTISVPPNNLVMALVIMTQLHGFIQNLNLTVEMIQQQLDPQGGTSEVFSVMTLG